MHIDYEIPSNMVDEKDVYINSSFNKFIMDMYNIFCVITTHVKEKNINYSMS